MNKNDRIAYDDITTQIIENDLILQKKLHLSVLRLDKIHPIISGNKWFKLKYYLQDAVAKQFDTLLTFGGAFSNHIVATAYAASMWQLSSIGIIRGERPAELSHTLKNAEASGMRLMFVSRDKYNELKRADINTLTYHFGNCYVIPEGGFGYWGARGAEDILRCVNLADYTHVIVGVGTGTTAAGIIKAALPHQRVIGISVMKNNTGLANEIAALTEGVLPDNFSIMHDYHFGGYAKYSADIIAFIHRFYNQTKVPLDFVYTAKVMFGTLDLIEKDYFSPRAGILMVHTGGLQGNLSLGPGVLPF
jgi:1-aminocyclopropane-1-carboxylate deaminase